MRHLRRIWVAMPARNATNAETNSRIAISINGESQLRRHQREGPGTRKDYAIPVQARAADRAPVSRAALPLMALSGVRPPIRSHLKPT